MNAGSVSVDDSSEELVLLQPENSGTMASDAVVRSQITGR
jgi:hypothetical protein